MRMRLDSGLGVSPPPCGVMDDSENQTHSVRLNSRSPSGGNCIKIGLPGKPIVRDYFQDNRTSRGALHKIGCFQNVPTVGTNLENRTFGVP